MARVIHGRVADKPSIEERRLLAMATMTSTGGLPMIFPAMADSYDQLLFRWEDIGGATHIAGAEIILQTSSDGSGFSATTSAYEFAMAGFAASGASADNGGTNIGILVGGEPVSTATGSMKGSGWALLINRETPQNHVIEWISSCLSTTSQFVYTTGRGRRNGATDVIKGMRIHSSANAFTEGTGYLYGLAKKFG